MELLSLAAILAPVVIAVVGLLSGRLLVPDENVSYSLRDAAESLRVLALELEAAAATEAADDETPDAVSIGEIEALLEAKLEEHARRQGRSAWLQGAFWFSLGVAVTVVASLLGG